MTARPARPATARPARLATAGAALLAFAVTAFLVLHADGPLWPLAAIAAGAAALLLAAGLAAAWAGGVSGALALLAVAYLLGLRGRHGTDPLAPAVGAALLATGELGYWSATLRAPAQQLARLATSRAGAIALLAAAGAAAAALELDAAAAVGRPGFPLEVAGIAAALAAVALLVRIRPPADRDRRPGRRG